MLLWLWPRHTPKHCKTHQDCFGKILSFLSLIQIACRSDYALSGIKATLYPCFASLFRKLQISPPTHTKKRCCVYIHVYKLTLTPAQKTKWQLIPSSSLLLHLSNIPLQKRNSILFYQTFLQNLRLFLPHL